jgi:glycine/D-amino acid oxidase-like deaminating enzyme
MIESNPIVHAYGHGGAGLTLAFGTADIAIDLVRKPISNDRTVVAQKIASFAKFYDLTTK